MAQFICPTTQVSCRTGKPARPHTFPGKCRCWIDSLNRPANRPGWFRMQRRGIGATCSTTGPAQTLVHLLEALKTATLGKVGPRSSRSTQVPVRTYVPSTTKVKDPLGWTASNVLLRHLRPFSRRFLRNPVRDGQAETCTPYPASPTRIYVDPASKASDLLGANRHLMTIRCCFSSGPRHHSNPWPLARSSKDNHTGEARTEVLVSNPDSRVD
jgi:hypothetical protein